MSDILRDYSFGGWVRNLRIKNGITLRAAAKALNTSAGNLSKLERSELAPPQNASRVVEIAHVIKSPESVELLKSLAFQHHLAVLKEEFSK